YRCPSDKNLPPGMTSYVAITGPETAWGARIDEVTDGASQTVMVIDSVGLGINWMEPRDLPASVATNGIDPPSANGMSSPHPGVVQAVFADAHLAPLEKSIDRKTLSAFFTRAG